MQFAVVALPAVVLASSLAAVIYFASDVLTTASETEVRLPSLWPLIVSILGLAVVSVLLILIQTTRAKRRLAGPYNRVVAALHRMRHGDLTFRVHVRRGDPYPDLARELNELLDWLNENPPVGASTGTDVIDLGDRLPEDDVPDEEGEGFLAAHVEGSGGETR